VTAYTITGPSGTLGVTTDFTPSGTPTTGDTLTIAAGKELRVPSGVWNMPTYTQGGSSGSNAKITVQTGSTLKLTAAPTVNDWSEYELQGNATIDLNGFNLLPTISDASGIRFKIFATGTALGGAKSIIKSGAAKATFGSLTAPIGIYISLNNFEIDNLHWRAGGSWYSGNVLSLQNGLVKNYGAFATSGYQDDGTDLVLKGLEFRNCNAPVDVNVGTVIADLGFHPSGDASGSGITGQRSFENIVFDATDTAGTQVKVKVYWLAGFTPKNLVFLDCQPYDGEGYMYWDGVFTKVRSESNAAFGVLKANNLAVVSHNDNPKHFSGEGTWNSPVIECKWLSGTSVDAGDLFVIGNTNPLVLNNVLLIDEFGSGIVNALSADRGANVTMSYATYVSDIRHPLNGVFRNEGGGRYTGTVSVTNSISYVRSNVTAAATIYGYNFGENTANDQLTTHGNNCWVNYPDQTNNAIYHAVNSASKTLGQANWGGGDIFTDPAFVDKTRGIMSFGASKGAATYADACQAVARGVNGYNKTSGTFNSGDIVVNTVKVYRDWVRAGFAPTAATYQANDSTGTKARGAVDWVQASSDGGITSSKITSSGITNSGLTS